MVAASFAMYQIPGVGERFLRRRALRLGPERLVAETLALCCVDVSRVDQAVVELMVEAATERQELPDAIPSFLQAARSLLSLSRRTAFGRQVMDRIQCPVLVIHGRQDRLVRVQTAIAACQAHPEWRLRIFEDTGHVAQLERPREWLDEVGAWLDDHPRVAGAAAVS
jgi:pimeloyl-ACP methyl ester carboxylesterase